MDTTKPVQFVPKIYVCEMEELANNEIRQFEPADRPPIAIYRVADQFYATDDTCTHGDASLSEGDIEDFTVRCPWHNGAFDIRTGEACSYPCILPVKTYAVVIEEQKVYLLLE